MLLPKFTGYEEQQTTGKIIALVVDNKQVPIVEQGTKAYVITDKSPFFVECGGQISDQGIIQRGEHQAQLQGLRKIGNTIGALITAPTTLKVGDSLELIVDTERRINTMKNHTATHLLQAALMELLGNEVRQSGSVVTPDYLRFDFTYHENLTPEQIKWVEDRVNEIIRNNIPVSITYTTLKEATDKGVIAIFGEKYQPEQVRIVDIPQFSAELCGGTHVPATGDIGCFKITEVSALSVGNRRIVALTGPAAIDLFQETFNTTKALGQEFKVPHHEVPQAVFKQKETLKETQQRLKELKKELFQLNIPTWLANLETIKVPFLFLELNDLEQEDLKELAQQCMRIQPGLYVFINKKPERSSFFISLAPQFTSTVDLKKLQAWLKTKGLQGGGSATTLQGGAKDIKSSLKEELKQWLKS